MYAKFVWRNSLGVLAFGLLFAAPLSESRAAPRIHVLIIGDTVNSTIGTSVKVDVERVEFFFQLYVPDSQLTVRTVAGNQASFRGITAAINDIRRSFAAGKDTLVVYISSHGAYDDRTNDHFALLPSGERLFRSNLRNAAALLEPHLTVILSDTCSSVRPPARELPAQPGAGRAEEMPPAFKSLFVDLRGVVDISATRPGESAQCDNVQGGYFTRMLCATVSDNAPQRIQWPEVIGATNQRVHRFFNPKQTAYAVLSLPDVHVQQLTTPRMRFGVVAERTARSARFNGVEVTRVVPGTPGQRVRNLTDGNTYTLVAGGHVITHVNGQPASSYDEFVAAVQRSPSIMRFRVVGLETERVDDYEARLTNGGVRFGVTGADTELSRRVGGVEVGEVIPGYPATRIRSDSDGLEYSLMAGVDVITQVNGHPVKSEQAFRAAVQQSPSQMRLRIFDSYHDKWDTYVAELYD